MALRSGYKGIKKLAAGLKWNRPGILAADDAALANTFFPRSEQAVLGATNIIPFPYYDGSSKTVDDVVFTVDGYDVKVNGANGNDYPQFQLCTATQLNNLLAKYGNLFISGCPSGGDASTYQIYTQGNNQTFTDRGEGMWLSASITYTTGVNIQMRPNYTANNVVFKPMVSLSDKNPYAEPAMTNRELTDNVASRVIFKTLSGGDLDDILTTGWYSWDGTAPAHSPQGVAYSCMQCIVETGVQKQIVYFGADVIYMRQRSGSPATWGSWYKFQGTIVS